MEAESCCILADREQMNSLEKERTKHNEKMDKERAGQCAVVAHSHKQWIKNLSRNLSTQRKASEKDQKKERLRARVLIHCLCEWATTAHCPARSLYIFFIVIGALFLQALHVLSVCKNAAAFSLHIFFSLVVGNGIRLIYFECKLF